MFAPVIFPSVKALITSGQEVGSYWRLPRSEGTAHMSGFIIKLNHAWQHNEAVKVLGATLKSSNRYTEMLNGVLEMRSPLYGFI